MIVSPLEGYSSHLFVKLSLAPVVIIGGTYIPPRSNYTVYRDHSLVVSTLADQCPDAKLMLFGHYNLSKIAWSSSLPLCAECTSYVDPNGIDAVNHVASMFTCLSLNQVFPAHSSKGYTLDLFSNVDSIFVSDPPDDFVFKSNDNHCPKLFSFPHKSFASLKPKLFYKNFFSCDLWPNYNQIIWN